MCALSVFWLIESSGLSNCSFRHFYLAINGNRNINFLFECPTLEVTLKCYILAQKNLSTSMLCTSVMYPTGSSFLSNLMTSTGCLSSRPIFSPNHSLVSSLSMFDCNNTLQALTTLSLSLSLSISLSLYLYLSLSFSLFTSLSLCMCLSHCLDATRLVYVDMHLQFMHCNNFAIVWSQDKESFLQDSPNCFHFRLKSSIFFSSLM